MLSCGEEQGGWSQKAAGDRTMTSSQTLQVLGGMFQTVVGREPSPPVENKVCGGSGCSPEARVDEEAAVGAEAKGPGLTLGSFSAVGVF